MLRKNKKPRSLEKCAAILVTSNVAFAKAAYEYGKNIEQSSGISTVITDFSLANISWLKAPLGAPTLPQKELIAFVYAALNPSQQFYKRVLDVAMQLEKDGKISARDHQILRGNPSVYEELMGMTLGGDAALDEESLIETLDRVSAEIKKEESDKLLIEQISHQETRLALEKQRDKYNRLIENAYWRSQKMSNWISLFTVAVIFVLTLYGVVIGYDIKENNILGWGLMTGSLICSILLIVHSLIGTTSLYKFLHKKIFNLIFAYIKKLLYTDTFDSKQ